MIALIGPLLESPGSAALRIMVHSTESLPQCSYNGTRVLDNPVVLQDTTLVPAAFKFSAWFAEDVYDKPVIECFSPPWKIHLTSADWYFSKLLAPTLPGEQSITISATSSKSDKPPWH